MTDIAIAATNLGKRYNLGRSGSRGGNTEFWALKDLAFEIERGQVIGVIGNNGAGKSTLLKVLSRITEPTMGSVRIKGRVGSLLEVGTGFHPELTGRENIYLNGVIIGMKKADIRTKFPEIVKFAGVEDFLDTPVKRYSSGMYMRLAFSVAAHLDPDILIIDEVLAVGDAAFQKKCLGKLRDVATQSKRTVLFVSHNLQAIQALCDRVMHLEQGRMVAFGDTRTVVSRYLETTSTTVPGAKRWGKDGPGNMGFQLESLEIRSNASSSGIYSSSQDLSVEFGFSVHSEIPGLRVGFELITAAGIPVFSSWQNDSAHPNLFSAHIGDNCWRCTVPAGLLNAGTYLISPKVTAAEGLSLVNDAATTEFEMVLDHGVSPYWNSLDATSRPGLIAPILNWKSALPGQSPREADSQKVADLAITR